MAGVQRILNIFKDVLPAPVLAAALRVNARLRPLPHATEERRLFLVLGSPNRVIGGPFRGMNYLSHSRGSVLVAKLLGSYELELHQAIEAAVGRAPDVVVDVGSAEGYYAVGLAVRVGEARVFAFDTDRYAQYLLQQLAKKNGVSSRLTIGGLCTVERLQATLSASRRPLVVCDCEGFEDELLRMDGAPDLARAMVLVELHEVVAPGIGERLRERFGKTHEVEQIFARLRGSGDLPAGVKLPLAEAEAVMAERRPEGMSWLVMMPRV